MNSYLNVESEEEDFLFETNFRDSSRQQPMRQTSAKVVFDDGEEPIQFLIEEPYNQVEAPQYKRAQSAHRAFETNYDGGFSNDLTAQPIKPAIHFKIEESELILDRKQTDDEDSADEKNDPLGYGRFSQVAQIFKKKHHKSVKFSTAFQETQKVREHDFTVYFVQIETQISEWIVAYRYSQLQKFHKKTKDKLKRTHKLPHFPPEHFWKNNSAVVTRRKAELSEYLNNLCRSVDILKDQECCQFFKIEEDTRALLIDMQSINRRNKQTTLQPFKQLQYQRMLRDDQIIQHFLQKMKNPSSRLAYLKEFETYYFDCQPQLEPAMIRTLLFGNLCDEDDIVDMQKSVKGLFVCMALHKVSILTATAAANILCKMIDFQKNRHADLVLSILCEQDPEFLRHFDVEALLDYECMSSVLTIYKAYIDRRCECLHADFCAALVNSEKKQQQLIEFYYNYNQRKNSSISSFSMGLSSQASGLRQSQRRISDAEKSSINMFIRTANKERNNSVRQQSRNQLITETSIGSTEIHKMSPHGSKQFTSSSEACKNSSSSVAKISSQGKAETTNKEEQPFSKKVAKFFGFQSSSSNDEELRLHAEETKQDEQ